MLTDEQDYNVVSLEAALHSCDIPLLTICVDVFSSCYYVLVLLCTSYHSCSTFNMWLCYNDLVVISVRLHNLLNTRSVEMLTLHTPLPFAWQ